MSRGMVLVVAFAGLSFAAGSSGCDDDAVDDDGAGAGDSVSQQIDPAPGGIRRLLARQYVNSIRYLFGASAAAAVTPPADLALHGFSSIGAADLALPESDVELYEASARAVGEALVADDAALAAVLDCLPEGAAAASCFASFVSDLGRLAWRRSLASDEVDAIVAVAIQAMEEYGDYKKGVVFAVMALLQAADFLYIVEVGEPDPKNASRRVLTPRELVTRMSFFLTDTTPSRELLDAADAGEAQSPDQIRALARDLLQQPEAKTALRSFFGEMYRLQRLGETAKDATLFPAWSPDLAEAMYESTMLLIEDVVWARGTDARELMTANYAFVNATLAPIYELTVVGSGFAKMTLPATQERAGIMGQAAIQSLNAHVDKTSATKRGVFVRRVLMCDDVPPPDPTVMLDLPEIDPADPKTMKELLLEHFENPACKSCHQLFDPVGLSFESFDAIGRFRDEDLGLPIDVTGDQPGLGTFSGPREVGQLLYESPKVAGCMVRSVYRHSMGHLEGEGEEVAIEAIVAAFDGGGYRFQDMLVEVAASPGFRLVGEPK